MPTETDTCRAYITPALQIAGWEFGPHSIAERVKKAAFFEEYGAGTR